MKVNRVYSPDIYKMQIVTGTGQQGRVIRPVCDMIPGQGGTS